MDGVLCLAENLRWWLARLGEVGVKDAAVAASAAAGPTPSQAQVSKHSLLFLILLYQCFALERVQL